MTPERALRIVIDACRAELVKLAFDANLYAKGLCDTPHAKSNYEKRERIKEAFRVLEGVIGDGNESEKETSSGE
jgi:hypothetical protein